MINYDEYDYDFNYTIEPVRPRFLIHYRAPFSDFWRTLEEGAKDFKTALAMVDRLDAAEYVIVDTQEWRISE